MRAGLVTLVVAYVLSQFYRAFLAVLTPVLEADIGATPDDLSQASGLWFLVFAAMQIPVGWLLDNVGPRRVAALIFGLGAAGGALVFALAQGPGHISLAMALIGIGCSPVLMSSYYIFARMFEARLFGTLAGIVIGVGSIGNVVASYPTAWAVETLGWRETMAGLAVMSLIVAAVIWVLVQDPPPAPKAEGGAAKGSVLSLLIIPALWLIFPLQIVNYAPSAGLRGLWAGPYLGEVFGMTSGGIGIVTLVMAVAMIGGNFLYGPADRIFGTRKWVILIGNLLSAAGLFGLWIWPASSVVTATVLLAIVGFFGSSFPLVMAHARAFVPAHLAGAGVTLINLMGIGGVALFQFLSGKVYRMADATGGDPAAPYQALFLFFGIPVVIGCAIYLFSQDRTD